MLNKVIRLNNLPFYGILMVALFPLLNIQGVSLSIIIFSLLSLIYLFADIKNRWSPDFKSFFLTTIPISLYVVGLFYTNDYYQAMKVFETGLPLFIFPFLYFIILGKKYVITPKMKSKVINTFILSGSILIIIIIGYLLYSGALYSLFDEIAALKVTHNRGSDIIRSTISSTPFFGEHPTYFGLIALFVSSLSFFKLSKTSKKHLISIIIGIIGVLISGSKMSIIVLLIIIIVLLFSLVKLKRNKIIIFSGIGFVVIFLFLILPTLNTRFGQVLKTKFEPPKGLIYNSTNVRIAVYQCTFQNIQESPIIGLGTAGYITGMKKCYKKYDTDIFKKRGYFYNSHNQYLSFALSNGVIGFFVFIFWIFIFLKSSIVNTNKYLFYSVLIFALMFMTENLLERQTGNVMFSLFIPLFYRFNKKNMKKRVYINARFLTQEITGVQRFAIEISRRINRKGLECVFIAPNNNIIHKELSLELKVKHIGWTSGYFWEQVELPLYLYSKGTPLLLNLMSTAPIFYLNKIYTLHDITYIKYPNNFSWLFRNTYKILVPLILKTSKRIITVSQFSKLEICSYYNLDKKLLDVVYNGVDDNFKDNNVSNSINNSPYFLAVSSLSENKNLSRLIEAFNQIEIDNLKLLIVGGIDTLRFKNILDLDILKKNKRIVFKGRVPDEELKSLYHNAITFIFPSLYEGFGIPPLEAQLTNCPVILSNIPPLKEIYGDSVLYCNPNSITDIKERMIQMISNKELRESLVEKGRVNADRYTWSKASNSIESILLKSINEED